MANSSTNKQALPIWEALTMDSITYDALMCVGVVILCYFSVLGSLLASLVLTMVEDYLP